MTEDAPAPASRPAPGTRLTFRWRKWDGSPHWVHDCVYLGSDQWGDWFGQREGWRSFRPGRDSAARGSNVSLLPPSGEYCFTWNEPPAATRIYIDVAWDVRWQEGEPAGIDMDLDVVRRDPSGPYRDRDGVLRQPGDVYIEDQDEWDEHRVAYGYPPHVVERLEQVAVDLETAVRAEHAPFDAATAHAWLARFDELEAAGLDSTG